MHRAILFEQCICCFVLLGTRLMIKPNNQPEAPDVIFQSSERRVEMVVLGVDVLQLGCRGLVRVSKQVCDNKWFDDAMWARKRSWRVAGIDGVQSRYNAEVIWGAKILGIALQRFDWKIANAVQLLLVKRLVMMPAGCADNIMAEHALQVSGCLSQIRLG